jgi:hypothetical protein
VLHVARSLTVAVGKAWQKNLLGFYSVCFSAPRRVKEVDMNG